MSRGFDSSWLLHENARRLGATAEPSPANAIEKESDLHASIMDFCRDMGWQFLHGAMSERTHRTQGEPDFNILASGGRCFLIECKSRTGKLSVEQQAFIAHAAKNGHTVHVVRSMDEFIKVVAGVAPIQHVQARD